jgi:hypothetical protein
MLCNRLVKQAYFIDDVHCCLYCTTYSVRQLEAGMYVGTVSIANGLEGLQYISQCAEGPHFLTKIRPILILLDN